MQNVQENIAMVEEALQAVLNHCMCAKFENTGSHYRVIYPEGNYPDGVQVSKGMGQAKALQKLAEVMERHWNSNGIHGQEN